MAWRQFPFGIGIRRFRTYWDPTGRSAVAALSWRRLRRWPVAAASGTARRTGPARGGKRREPPGNRTASGRKGYGRPASHEFVGTAKVCAADSRAFLHHFQPLRIGSGDSSDSPQRAFVKAISRPVEASSRGGGGAPAIPIIAERSGRMA